MKGRQKEPASRSVLDSRPRSLLLLGCVLRLSLPIEPSDCLLPVSASSSPAQLCPCYSMPLGACTIADEGDGLAAVYLLGPSKDLLGPLGNIQRVVLMSLCVLTGCRGPRQSPAGAAGWVE